MPFGTRAPSLWNRAGSLRKSTTSWSSAFTSSSPATSSHVMDDFELGGTCVVRMRGISWIVRHSK